MHQPAKWVWGLLPLGLMWFASNQFFKADAVRSDLTVKAVAAANGVANSAPGLKTISVDVRGRDVHLSGETLDAAQSAQAMAAVDKEAGVRLVTGGLTVAAMQKPYTWAATRMGSKITLSGYVPDESVKKANAEAAAKAFDGAVVDDQQKIAFGAPLGFATMTTSAIPNIARLGAGAFSINDTRFCVEGEASSPANYTDLRAKMTAMPQTAFALSDCALKPPTVSPYVWGAEKINASTVSLTGLVPSDDLRKQILASAKSAFPAATITDLMQPALGAPAGLAALAASGLGDLSRLVSGKIALAGNSLAISGQGPVDASACQALKREMTARTGDGITRGVDGLICPAPPPVAVATPAPVQVPAVPAPAIPAVTAPPPPAPAPAAVPAELRVTKSQSELVISGLAPSDAAKAALLQAAQAAAPQLALRDATVLIRPNLQAAPDYKATTEFGLAALGQMTTGEMSINGAEMTLSGTANSPEARAAIEEKLRATTPAGLRIAKSSLLVRPYDFTVQSDKSGVVLSGYVPDAATKNEIFSLADTGPMKGRVRDEMRVVTDAPASFGMALKAALQSVMRLDIGTAYVSNQSAAIQGMTCRDLIKNEVETRARDEQPQGFAGVATVSLRQTGCLIDPPNTCQADLDNMTRKNAILFKQSLADLDAAPGTDAAIAEVAAILQKCPTAAIRIEGHTNRDGERYGYNNQRLSENRAEMVLGELARRGIAASRLSATGYGSKNPLLPHNTEEGREKNRRVQFTVAKP